MSIPEQAKLELKAKHFADEYIHFLGVGFPITASCEEWLADKVDVVESSCLVNRTIYAMVQDGGERHVLSFKMVAEYRINNLDFDINQINELGLAGDDTVRVFDVILEDSYEYRERKKE